jgi:hypothetical protein
MCEPISIGAVTITATETAMIALTVAATAASVAMQNAAAKRQADQLGKNNQLQADQITKSNAQEMNVNQQKAYAERGAMRSAGAESGINLGSGSFMAAMQTSAIQQSNTNGLIVANNNSAQLARQSNANSDLAKIPYTSGGLAALQIAGAGASGYMAGGGGKPATPSLTSAGSAAAASVTPK